MEAGNSALSVALSLYFGSLQASKLEEGKYAVKWAEEEGEDCERMRSRAWHAGRDVVVCRLQIQSTTSRAPPESWQPTARSESQHKFGNGAPSDADRDTNKFGPRRTLWLENSEIAYPPAILRSAAFGTHVVHKSLTISDCMFRSPLPMTMA